MQAYDVHMLDPTNGQFLCDLQLLRAEVSGSRR